MANSNVVHFVVAEDVLQAIGEMDTNRAHETLSIACEWFILNKAPMALTDLVPTRPINGGEQSFRREPAD